MSNHVNWHRSHQRVRIERSVPERYRRGRFTSRKATDADLRYFDRRAERRASNVALFVRARES